MMSLADAIIAERIDFVREMLSYGADVNEIDEYGFTILIEAAIADHFEIAKLLLEAGADVNQPDMLGGTALHWAAENNNVRLCELLLKQGADPNQSNIMGQPILVMPLLRQQTELKKLLLNYGAQLEFAQDYINTKQLGHLYELVGTANIIDPKNYFIEVDFEGFFLEVSIAMIAESLAQFNNHFAARRLRQYVPTMQRIVDILMRAQQLTRYQHYRVNIEKYHFAIQQLLQHEPVVLPVGYEGHAITFIKFDHILVKCDRREDSRLYDNIVFYRMGHAERMDQAFIENLLYEKLSGDYINQYLHQALQLQPITELKVHAQISGNCSWANVEACIPALFFLFMTQHEDFSKNMSRYKNLALSIFNQWREWNKDRSLQFCIESFRDADKIRKACKAELLAAILFQSCGGGTPKDEERASLILSVLLDSPYQYLLKNYVQVYCYESQSAEGKNFLQMLKKFGYEPN